MTVDFNIPDDIDVDESLYRPDTKSMPIITWHGKAGSDNSTTGGRWIIKANAIEGQTPKPDGWWEKLGMRFGSDPNAEIEEVWATRRLRCVPIGIRKRQVIFDIYGKKWFFPHMTKKENRVDSNGAKIEQKPKGGYKANYQVMVMVDGISSPIVVALFGYTKTVCWDNVPNGQYGNKEFPKGVEQSLTQLAADASKEKKTRIPWLCFWTVDLIPVFEAKDKPLWVEVGSEDTVFMNPFTIDMKTGDNYLLNSRFVGTDKFLAYQNLRREVAMDWEAQWANAANLASEGDGAYNYDEPASNTVEEDEIPF